MARKANTYILLIKDKNGIYVPNYAFSTRAYAYKVKKALRKKLLEKGYKGFKIEVKAI